MLIIATRLDNIRDFIVRGSREHATAAIRSRMCSARVRVVGMAIVRGSIVVAMVAVDDVGGHKLVDDSRDDLDANKACGKEAHHNKASSLIGPTLLLKVFFGLGEHAEQRGEELEVEKTGGSGQLAVLYNWTGSRRGQ